MQGECHEDSYHVNLVINILVRFPEIFTVTYNLDSSSFSLSYMISRKLSRENYISLCHQLEENLEAYRYFKKKESRKMEIKKKSLCGYTQLEIALAGDSLLGNEIALLTSIMRDQFGQDLICEMRMEESDYPDDEPASWDDLLELLLNRNPGNNTKKLFAFRDAGKVYVFDK